MSEQTLSVVDLIAKKFIQRKDVRAVQHNSGAYSPVYEPWTREVLAEHISGRQTFGHYLLDTESYCKLFAFDIDLEKPDPNKGIFYYYTDPEGKQIEFNPRETWRDRSHSYRDQLKEDFKLLAHKLLKYIDEALGIPSAAAYTGSKGIHVYGFTGKIAAAEARDAALIVLDLLSGFEPTRGQNFFKHPEWPNLSLEIFPKQDSLDGKKLGNLMRLPLGRNLKSNDPTFFIDMTSPLSVMQPVDPVWALTAPSPWTRPDE